MPDAYRPARAYEFSLTVRQILALIGGTVVVVVVAFGIGVGFGHRLATTPVATTTPMGLDQLDAKTTPSPVPSPQPVLTYQQDLLKNDVAAKGAASSPKPAEPAPSPKPEPAAPSPSPVAEKPADPVVPAVAKPEDKPKAEVAEAKPAAKAERWTIQFGAPKQKSEADKLVAKLASVGLAPFVVEADIPGKGHFYRVRVGQFASKEEAERSRATAETKAKLSGVTMTMQ